MSIDAKDRKRQYIRPQDNWQCSLDETQSCGGTGTHLAGEEICNPHPSLRFQRGIFTASCTALIAGILLACMASPSRNEFVAPGALSNHHAQILATGGTRRCASCHGAGDKSIGDWIRDAVSSGRHIPVSQSQLCMDCHDQHLAAEFAIHAHSMDPDQLAKITANSSSGHSLAGFPDPRNAKGQLACATCHREHHGAEFNLTALTDRQCQTCHVKHIHSFETDHPEFTNWPLQNGTNIAFDHVSHADKHFREKNYEFDCRQCHVDDGQGNVKLVASFDTSCASCHESRVTGASTPDWTFFRMPMLDIDALNSAGHSIGQWPENCSGDFDGSLPPTMRLLMMADPGTARILNQYEDNFDFSDMDPDNEQHLADAATLAWSIKQLLHDLAIDGNLAIRKRLELSIEAKIMPRQMIGLAHGLNPAIFGQAQQRWIPGLHQEIESRTRTGPRRDVNNHLQFKVFARPTLQSTDDELLAINPLKDLFAGKQRSPLSREEGPGSIVNSSQSPDSGESSSRNDSGDLRDDDDRLAVNPLDALISGSPAEVPDRSPPPRSETSEPATPPPGVQPNVYEHRSLANDALPHRDSVGWNRNDTDFSISYRVSGHLDPLIKNWTDLAAEHHKHRAVEHSRLYQMMDSALTSGQCRSCHTVARSGNESLQVQWQPEYRDVSVRGFTRFSHRPHDIQSSLLDCTSCHNLNRSRSHGSEAGTTVSDFAPVRKSTCASCHRPDGAPSGCVDCHNYHVGSRLKGER